MAIKPLALLILVGLSVTAWANPLDWKALRLAPGDDTRHLQALLAFVPGKTAGWKHYPLRMGGNFLTERWMKGEGDVLNSSFMQSPGSSWYEVEALHYNLPDAFGCLVSAGQNPASDGLGIHFWYASGGQSIVGEGADLDFTVWQDGKTTARLPVLRVPVDLPEPFEVEGPLLKEDWRANLAVLSDQEHFLTSTRQRYSSTVVAFHQALAQGLVRKRVYGEYKGGGIPPESELVALSPKEAEELKRYVDAKAAEWQKGLQKHGPEMFKLFYSLVPLSNLID